MKHVDLQNIPICPYCDKVIESGFSWVIGKNEVRETCPYCNKIFIKKTNLVCFVSTYGIHGQEYGFK